MTRNLKANLLLTGAVWVFAAAAHADGIHDLHTPFGVTAWRHESELGEARAEGPVVYVRPNKAGTALDMTVYAPDGPVGAGTPETSKLAIMTRLDWQWGSRPGPFRRVGNCTYTYHEDDVCTAAEYSLTAGKRLTLNGTTTHSAAYSHILEDSYLPLRWQGVELDSPAGSAVLRDGLWIGYGPDPTMRQMLRTSTGTRFVDGPPVLNFSGGVTLVTAHEPLPVPEPATAGLSVFAWLALLANGRRKAGFTSTGRQLRREATDAE